jgi:hypothetical protein
MKYEYVYESVQKLEDGAFRVDAQYIRDGVNREYLEFVKSFSEAQQTVANFRKQFREALTLGPDPKADEVLRGRDLPA